MGRAALPPMAAVRAFEAAARHLNFTRAAAELNMTQAAVSYQIKMLEDRVGTNLFVRQPRGVTLSDTGRQFAAQTTEALTILADAFAQARGEVHETLAISVIPTFATNVLSLRLGAFQMANPTIAVRVEVSDGLASFDTSQVDLAIRAGKGDWPGLACHLLLRTAFTPMLSPALARSIGGIREPADLLKLPILSPRDRWWPHWLTAMGVKDVDLSDRPDQRPGPQVLEANAAVAGQGVGMLTPAFHRELVAQGRLIQPFQRVCDDGTGYWLVYPESRRNTPKIARFRDWLLPAMAGFTDEPSGGAAP